MTAERFVLTQAVREAVKGRETEVLQALGIGWPDGTPHISCPYPDHADEDPSWRWDERRVRAYCTCIEGSHSIFEIAMGFEGLEFDAAKLRIAELLGRQDLIQEKTAEIHQRMDAAGLLQPPSDQRDDRLPSAYLAHRLGVASDQVPTPSTPIAGWRALPYYDAPARKGAKPKLVGYHPCTVFGTLAPDGRRHAHRIYVATGGKGKADLGAGRDPKKSARLKEGQSATGCGVLWGDPAIAPHLLLVEGIETSAALAVAHRAEIDAGEMAIASALSTSGIRVFVPWPSIQRITVTADRDEARPPNDRGYRAGEKAAHAFALKHHERLEIRMALPGSPGQDIDWLDVLLRDGVEAVRAAILTAPIYVPTSSDDWTPEDEAPDPSVVELLIERAKRDPGAPFEREALKELANLRRADPPLFQRTWQDLKQTGVRLRDLERELRRVSLHVIEGGKDGAGFEAVVEAGSYFVTSGGVIAWRKETRDGSVPTPLCNFGARIVAEEVHDDGAGQRTVLAIEGQMPDGRPLPCVKVPAERYFAMTWVTEVWGTAPVILAGQGKKDHLRAAIQMLSGRVPRHTVYGHLGWRKISDEWAFLHNDGAIGSDGGRNDVEIETDTDGFQPYRLPEPGADPDVVAAVRASLDLLDLGPDLITAPLLGAVYRAPLGEAAVIDFSIHITGPTGVFKSELAVLAQAHFGSGFHSRRLPASWADTANMLEKKAFLAKDAVLVVDDFAPAGTATDVQRLHREADRLFRAAGNRSGRARMRADGGSRPTYYPRGLIISTGEDIPSGQSLRARLLVLEVAPGDVLPELLSKGQASAAAGILAAAMAGYLRWLAPRMDELADVLPRRQRDLRAALLREGQHRRTPEITASLLLAWQLFVEFAQQIGAIADDEAASQLTRVQPALSGIAESQLAHQRAEDPAGRFLALLRAAISSGRAHVADANTGTEPENAACWGWQLHVVSTGQYEHEEWRPNGECLGWIRDEDLLLDPDAAFATAQKLARDQGTTIPIKQRTLWKRLAEEELLASRDGARNTNTIRRTIQGLRRELIHLRTSALAAETDQQTDETAQTDQQPDEKGKQIQGRGQFGQFGQKIEHRGPPERDLRAAVGWEVEI